MIINVKKKKIDKICQIKLYITKQMGFFSLNAKLKKDVFLTKSISGVGLHLCLIFREKYVFNEISFFSLYLW